MKTIYLLLATLLISTMVNAVPTPIDPKAFKLVTDMTSLAGAVSELHEALAPRQRTVTQVIEAATTVRSDLCNPLVYGPLTKQSGSEVVGYCWTDNDDAGQNWFPQGVTTSHDASDDGTYENKTVILNSWYHVPAGEGAGVPNKGVRIAFTEFDSEANDTYIHVLLVQPTAGGNYKIIPVHAGGIMWLGNYLYIADTWNGFRIFDMNHIYEADVDSNSVYKFGKQADGKYNAFNYKFILVQTGWSRNVGSALQYSFVSLDRLSNPISMITGEYSLGRVDDNNTNVVRFPLNSTTLLPLASDDGKTYATEAYETHILKMQGALARDGRFWFSSSSGGASGPVGNYGKLRVWDRNTTEVRSHLWTYASEDLSYWQDPINNDDLIWTLTEFVNNRIVVAIPSAQWA